MLIAPPRAGEGNLGNKDVGGEPRVFSGVPVPSPLNTTWWRPQRDGGIRIRRALRLGIASLYFAMAAGSRFGVIVMSSCVPRLGQIYPHRDKQNIHSRSEGEDGTKSMPPVLPMLRKRW